VNENATSGQALAYAIDRAGYVMVLSATIAWSTGGFFVRLIHVDLWTMHAQSPYWTRRRHHDIGSRRTCHVVR
jgi:hypothetical protein